MPIPESQLETWSHQGAVVSSAATYQSIQTALTASTSPVRGKNFEVYLQGSYKNDTNIRGDSDVDVVVQLNGTFGYDLSRLDSAQRDAFEQAYPINATYRWADFRADVLEALRNYYGSAAIEEGDKALKLSPTSSRLGVDVIPALHFLRYTSFYGPNIEGHIDGIKLWNPSQTQAIINFPKAHHANGVAKNSILQTKGWYKPTVRIFKNARTCLIERGMIADDLAPSYFVEGLLYNVPDAKFGNSFEDTFVEAFNWLWSKAPVDKLICQNAQLLLFGPAAEQWNINGAKQFLAALKQLWENW